MSLRSPARHPKGNPAHRLALAGAWEERGAAGMVKRVLALAAHVPEAPFEIPGASGDGPFRIQILNQDQAQGVVTSIVHLPPGARIPAHRHSAGAEMHYVLEGELIDRGETLGPGAFLTHAAGVVHGPHVSRGGAKVLTVQGWQSRDGAHDFEPVEEGAAPTPDEATPEGGRSDEGPRQPGESAAAAVQRRSAEEGLGRGYG